MQKYPKRFLDKIDQQKDCWIWNAAKHRQGYGNYFLNGKVMLAHRVSYFYHSGYMPKPHEKVCHKCDNESCVNPDHLFLGTQANNVRDMMQKGRGRKRGLSGEKNPRSKLTEQQARFIRSSDLPTSKIARMLGVGDSTVSMVRRGHNWAWIDD